MDIQEYNLRKTAIEFEQSNTMLAWMGSLVKNMFTSLIMINGGAIIALLTFIGNSKFVKTFSTLWVFAIGFFCAGIITTTISMCFAFFSQKIFREGLNIEIKQGKETDNKIKNQKGITFRNIAIFCIILSIIFFITGVGFSLEALKNSLQNQIH